MSNDLDKALEKIANTVLGNKASTGKLPKLVRIFVTNHTYNRTADDADYHKVDFMFQEPGSDADPVAPDPDATFLIRGAVVIAGWMPRIQSWAYALSLGQGAYVVMPIVEHEQIFVHAGPLEENTSPVYRAPYGAMYLREIQANIKLTGSSDVEVEVYIREINDGMSDGTLIGTITIVAGDYEKVYSETDIAGWVEQRVEYDQALMLKVTDVGTNAEDLTVAIRYI